MSAKTQHAGFKSRQAVAARRAAAAGRREMTSNLCFIISSCKGQFIYRQSDMKDVCIAMIPTLAFGCFQFERSALIVVIAWILSCVLAEYLYEIYEQTDNYIGDFRL